MKPDVDVVLRMVATKLLSEIAPSLGDAYVRSNLEVAAALLIVAAEDYDRAAHVRVEENRAMRSLFRETAADVADDALRGKLTAASQTEDTSFRIRDLDAANGELRSLLIELHAYAETRGDEWGAATRRAVWRELSAGADRRAIGFYPL